MIHGAITAQVVPAFQLQFGAVHTQQNFYARSINARSGRGLIK